jgi:hypothetical protein
MNTSQATMNRLFAALLSISLLVAACGGGGEATPSTSARASGAPSTGASLAPSAVPSDSAAPSESADATPAAPAQLLTCAPQGPGWSVAKLDGAADAEAGTTAAAKALLDYVTGVDGTDLPDTGWHELYRSKEVALYGQSDPSGEPDVLLVATVRATNGVWSGEDSGQCRPQTWLGNSLGIAATWRLSAKTTKTSKSLKVLVTEKACASGESAKGRIAKPRISYEDDRVVVTIGVTPLDGEQDCKSNPATPLTVTLSEALGDRQLFDGGPYPAVEVAQPK